MPRSLHASVRPLALGLALALAAIASPARAQDANMEEAKTHVAKAKVHYDLGEYQQAAEEYIIVYRLKPLPALLFNIAQSYRQAALYEKARQFYRSYLRENPDQKTRLSIEKAIRELDELLAKDKKTREAGPNGIASPGPLQRPDGLALPPGAQKSPAAVSGGLALPGGLVAPVQPPATSQAPAGARPADARAASGGVQVAVAEGRKNAPAGSTGLARAAPTAAVTPSVAAQQEGGGSHTLAYVTGGVAVALLAGGGLFAVQAARADNELTAGAHTRSEADTLISTSKSKHTLSAVLLGTGALAAIGAGVLFLLPSRDGVAVQGKF